MPSKTHQLKTEIATTAYSSMTDAEIAAALNAAGTGADLVRDVDVGQLERLMASEGILLALRDYAATGTDATVQAVCREMLALIDSVNVTEFNVRNPRAQAGLDVLVASGLLTAAQRGAVDALAVTQRTRAEELGLGAVTADDVYRARTL